VSDPFRTAPPTRSRFFVSADVFMDLDEVIAAFWFDTGERVQDIAVANANAYYTLINRMAEALVLEVDAPREDSAEGTLECGLTELMRDYKSASRRVEDLEAKLDDVRTYDRKHADEEDACVHAVRGADGFGVLLRIAGEELLARPRQARVLAARLLRAADNAEAGIDESVEPCLSGCHPRSE
jgi:hypothetical protein